MAVLEIIAHLSLELSGLVVIGHYVLGDDLVSHIDVSFHNASPTSINREWQRSSRHSTETNERGREWQCTALTGETDDAERRDERLLKKYPHSLKLTSKSCCARSRQSARMASALRPVARRRHFKPDIPA